MAFSGIFQPFERLRWIRFGLLMRTVNSRAAFPFRKQRPLQSVARPLLLLLLVNINSNNLAAMKTLVVCAFAFYPLTVVAAGNEVAGLAGLPN